MTSQAGRTRVVVICPVFANYDAIGASARDTYRALSGDSRFSVTAITLGNQFEDVSARRVTGVADLLLDPPFLTAEVIIYHFGIYCELFDALIAAKGRALQIVRFHNVTPSQYVVPRYQELIERSLRQVHNFSYADELWADSLVNAESLVSLGIDGSRIHVLPLAVENPAPQSLCGKAPIPINLLFVGRFVPSKGVLDLIEAVDLLRRRSSLPFRLRLAGNMEWSDPAYFKQVQKAVEIRNLQPIVQVLGTVNSDLLEELYHTSHILVVPSYHEGFCKPIIEGLRAGCIPIGYDAHNLPAISNGFGRMVQTGDIHALGMALQEVIEGITRSLAAPEDPLLPLDTGRISAREFDEATCEYVRMFSFDRLASATLQRIHALRFGFTDQ